MKIALIGLQQPAAMQLPLTGSCTLALRPFALHTSRAHVIISRDVDQAGAVCSLCQRLGFGAINAISMLQTCSVPEMAPRRLVRPLTALAVMYVQRSCLGSNLCHCMKGCTC